MAVRIQFRRGTAAEWTAANPTLSAGEFGFETDTRQFKLGDGSTAWSGLAYPATGTITGVTAGTGLTDGGTSGVVTLNLDTTAVIPPTTVNSKGDLIVGTADDTVDRLGVGTDGQVLSANSGETAGLEWVTPYGPTTPTEFTSVSTTSYTVSSSDAGKVLIVNTSNPTTITLTTTGLSTGQQIVVHQYGTGSVSFSATSPAVINSRDGLTTIAGQHSAVSLIKYDTNNWIMIGDLI
jgi:hypothetical protein